MSRFSRFSKFSTRDHPYSRETLQHPYLHVTLKYKVEKFYEKFLRSLEQEIKELKEISKPIKQDT